MKKTVLLFMVLLLHTVTTFAAGDDVNIEDLIREINSLKIRVAELERKLALKKGEPLVESKKVITEGKDKIEHIDTHILHKEGAGYQLDGLRIGAGATFVSQYAIKPNVSGSESSVLDGTYSLDLEIEKEIGTSGLVFVHLEAGQGNGLDDDEINTFSAVNRDAGDSGMDVEVTELWYEHNFFDNKVVFTGGKLDTTVYLDQNAIANNETSQFLSTTFRNSTAIDFPTDLNTFGFRAAISPVEWFEVGTGIFDDDNDWEDLFEDYFIFSQINIKPNLFEREGNYRIYIWYDDSNHIKWSDPGTTTQPNFGFGVNYDQRLLDCLTIFGRCGWQDPDVSVVEWAWSTGFQLNGTPWGRDNDYLGYAVGMDIPGGDYDDFSGNFGRPEGHIETYYNFCINENLHISPDYQFIWNPNGERRVPINIIGIRGQVDF